MNDKLVLLVVAATLPLALPAAAHLPPAPDTNCNPAAFVHDFVGASSATVTTGITGEFGGGITIVFDGSLLPCGSEDFCPPGEEFIVVDPSGDDLPDGTDPSGDSIVIPCDDILIGNTQLPVGDGEFEFGLGGAFLPDTHHDPLTNGYTVSAALADGGFIFCSDAENDGDCEAGSADCYESHPSASPVNFNTACPPGGDGGWWFFAKCNAHALHDSTLWGEGPLTGDDDNDGRPNAQHDTDDDGIPNGLQDDDNGFLDGDGTPDIFEDADGNGIPDGFDGNTLNASPGTIPPDASASCLLLGHVGDGVCSPLVGCDPPRPQCSDLQDNDGDLLIDWPLDPGCGSPTDEDEGDAFQCSDGVDNDGDGFADWPLDPGCEGRDDNDEGNVPQCSDGVDNDGDGFADWPADLGCTGPWDDDETEEPHDPIDVLPECSNFRDDDGDGFTDWGGGPGNDWYCDGPLDDNEGPPECRDGVDNDGDGAADWPDDPGCESSEDDSEGDPTTHLECSDGLDNDKDGDSDWPNDPDCESPYDDDESQ